MKNEDKKQEETRVAYPKPSETDNQLKNQPEYIDQEPNKFKKEISDKEENRTGRDEHQIL